MKNILLFGAGKSATVLINYFLQHAEAESWHLIVVDDNAALAKEKVGSSTAGTVYSFDINDASERGRMIPQADIVISLMPPTLHLLIAKDCLKHKKNLLTASYIDAALSDLKNEIEESGLLFLCETGLDPGIDHMSAKKLIDEIEADGGNIDSFHSHCGGLVAPESDNNPWHYKISWNPRNVVMAGKAGAIYKMDGNIVEQQYEELFAEKKFVNIPGTEQLCWYPNRDSLSYINVYGLHGAHTFIRTTLRHPDFMYGWKNIVDLQLTNEKTTVQTDGLSLAQFFKRHFDEHGFSGWLEQKLMAHFDITKNLLKELVNLVDLEQKAAEKGVGPVEEFMLVNDKGDLQEVDIDDLKINAATTLAEKMHDANLTMKQLFYLGMDDQETLINKGACSTAGVLQLVLEKKLTLQPADKDMVVMHHEIEFSREEKNYRATSTMILNGENETQTAMAKTVGLPLALAAKLILNNTIALKGLHIPVVKEIYKPLLHELALEGIVFTEEIIEVE